MSATKEKQWRETVVYAGRRLHPNQQVQQLFLREGKEMRFVGVWQQKRLVEYLVYEAGRTAAKKRRR